MPFFHSPNFGAYVSQQCLRLFCLLDNIILIWGGTWCIIRRLGHSPGTERAPAVILSPPHLFRKLLEASRMRPFCVEDPLREGQFRTQLPELRQISTIPIAAGEEWGTRAEFSELINRRDIDFARASLPNVGRNHGDA